MAVRLIPLAALCSLLVACGGKSPEAAGAAGAGTGPGAAPATAAGSGAASGVAAVAAPASAPPVSVSVVRAQKRDVAVQADVRPGGASVTVGGRF